MTNSSTGNDCEAAKMSYDFYKYLSALNTGTILVIISFIQSSSVPSNSDLLFIPLILFIFSMLASIYVMYIISHVIHVKIFVYISAIFQLISWIFFIAGIVLLVYFAA